MSELSVTAGGMLAIGVIVWWFWLSSPPAVRAAASVPLEIRVEGGSYQPAVISIAAGKPLTLRFLRSDSTPCAEQVVFAGLNLSADLPLGQARDVVLPALPPGTYEFTCQMGMYRGKLVVT